MPDMNRVTLVGRLTRDPEVKQTANGNTLATMRIACNQRAKQQDGTWAESGHYFDIVCYGRTAETAGSYLVKGRRVGVDGRLQWREWEAKDGGKRQAVEVVANDVFFLDSREEGAAPKKRGGDLPIDNIDAIPF